MLGGDRLRVSDPLVDDVEQEIFRKLRLSGAAKVLEQLVASVDLVFYPAEDQARAYNHFMTLISSNERDGERAWNCNQKYSERKLPKASELPGVRGRACPFPLGYAAGD